MRNEGTIVPGETQVYYVDVGWGQRPQAQVAFSSLDGTSYGTSQIGTELLIYSPARANATTLLPKNSRGEDTRFSGYIGLDGADFLQATTVPVAYQNRKTPVGAAEHDSAPVLAGKYAIVLSADPSTSKDVPSYPIEFAMDVSVEGDVVGKPAYDGNPKPTGVASVDDDRAKSNGDKQDQGSKMPAVLTAVGVAALLTAALGAAVLFFRSRRSG